MTAKTGRLMYITKNDVVIAGGRAKEFAFEGESIDITSGEDNGFRLLLAASGQEAINVTYDGVTKEDIFRVIAFDTTQSKMLSDIKLHFSITDDANTTEAQIAGDFRMPSYSESGAHDGAVEFSLSFESSGQWTYTAEAA